MIFKEYTSLKRGGTANKLFDLPRKFLLLLSLKYIKKFPQSNDERKLKN